MKNDDSQLTLLVIAIVVGVALVGVWQFSRSIGSDFQITLRALGISVLILGVLGAVWWFTEWKISLMGSLAATWIWPTWWGVLDSIANGGTNPETSFFKMQSDVWWNGHLFKWGLEGLLVALLSYFIVRQLNDRY